MGLHGRRCLLLGNLGYSMLCSTSAVWAGFAGRCPVWQRTGMDGTPRVVILTTSVPGGGVTSIRVVNVCNFLCLQ